MEPFGMIDRIVFDTEKQDRLIEAFKTCTTTKGRQDLFNFMDELVDTMHTDAMDVFVARIASVYSDDIGGPMKISQFIALYSKDQEQTQHRVNLTRLMR